MEFVLVIIIGVPFALFVYFMYSAAIGSFLQHLDEGDKGSNKLKSRNLIIGAVLMFFMIMLFSMCAS